MSDGISIATMLRSKQACSRTPPRSNEAKQAARSSGVTPIAEHCSPSPVSAPAALGQRPSARTAPSPHAGRAQAQLRARRCLNAGAKLPTCTLPLAPLAAPAGGPHPRPAAVARSAAPREATGAVRAGQRQGRPRARSGSRAAARRFAALPALPVVSRCALLAAGLLYASAVTQTNEGGHRHAGSSPCPTDGRGASRPPRTSRFRAASPGPLRSNLPSPHRRSTRGVPARSRGAVPTHAERRVPPTRGRRSFAARPAPLGRSPPIRPVPPGSAGRNRCGRGAHRPPARRTRVSWRRRRSLPSSSSTCPSGTSGRADGMPRAPLPAARRLPRAGRTAPSRAQPPRAPRPPARMTAPLLLPAAAAAARPGGAGRGAGGAGGRAGSGGTQRPRRRREGSGALRCAEAAQRGQPPAPQPFPPHPRASGRAVARELGVTARCV